MVLLNIYTKYKDMVPQLIKELRSEREQIIKELQNYEEIIRKETALKNKLAGINSLLSFYEESPSSQDGESGGNKNGYDINLTWTDKIKYALTKIGSGYTADIANKIQELDPTLDKKRIKEATSFYLSKLLKANEVKKIGQTGKKYKFSI